MFQQAALYQSRWFVFLRFIYWFQIRAALSDGCFWRSSAEVYNHSDFSQRWPRKAINNWERRTGSWSKVQHSLKSASETPPGNLQLERNHLQQIKQVWGSFHSQVHLKCFTCWKLLKLIQGEPDQKHLHVSAEAFHLQQPTYDFYLLWALPRNHFKCSQLSKNESPVGLQMSNGQPKLLLTVHEFNQAPNPKYIPSCSWFSRSEFSSGPSRLHFIDFYTQTQLIN